MSNQYQEFNDQQTGQTGAQGYGTHPKSKKKLAIGLTAFFLLGAGGGAAAYFLSRSGANNPNNPPQGTPLNFIAVGDWGTANSTTHDSSTGKDPYQSPAYWEDFNSQENIGYLMGIWAKQNPIEFVMSHGDNFYWNGIESNTDPRWNITFENVYNYSSLMVPWLNVFGNHDYGGGSDIKGGDKAMESLFQAQATYKSPYREWVLDGHYYSRVFKHTEKNGDTFDIEVFNIDTNAAKIHGYDEICCQTYGYPNKGCDDDVCKKEFDYKGGCAPKTDVDSCRVYLAKQFDDSMTWLESALAKSKAKWKVVNSHYHPRMHMQDPHQGRLYSILKAGGVHAFFCGHTHAEGHDYRDSVHYFLNGAGGGIRKDGEDSGVGAQIVFSETNYAFIGAQVYSNEMVIKFYGWGDGWTNWAIPKTGTAKVIHCWSVPLDGSIGGNSTCTAQQLQN